MVLRTIVTLGLNTSIALELIGHPFTGVHPKTGLTTGDFEEAAVKRALSRAAGETIVLASSEKLNAASPYAVVPLSAISEIITERAVKPTLTRPYEKLGIRVTRA